MKKAKQNSNIIQNACMLEKKSFFHYYFLVVDAKEHIAERFFRNEQVKVEELGRLMVEDDNTYEVMLCRIQKKDINKFSNALTNFLEKMILLGHENYRDKSLEIINKLTD